METKQVHYYDIAANLSDDQFKGVYQSKTKHAPDLDRVFKRSHDFGVTHLLLASGNIPDLEESYELCKKNQNYYTTAGVHPCRANEAVEDIGKYFKRLEGLIEKNIDKSEVSGIGRGDIWLSGL